MTQPQPATSGMSPSLVRTLVPMIVGYVVSIAARHGFHINDDQAASAITVGVSYGYYVIVRFLETHQSSKFGWLLGSAKTPTYVTPPAVVTDGGGTRVVEAPEDGSDGPVDVAVDSTGLAAVDIPVEDQVLPLVPPLPPVKKPRKRLK